MSTLASDVAEPTALSTTGRSRFSTLVVTTLTTGAGAPAGALPAGALPAGVVPEGGVGEAGAAAGAPLFETDAGAAGLSASGAALLEQATRPQRVNALQNVSKTKWTGERAAKFMLSKS